MHRKSLEAAQHLKDSENCSNSDHDETTSMRTESSDTSISSGQQQRQQPSAPPNHAVSTGTDKDGHHGSTQPYSSEDPEVFRNNSIACLRAKAQEHSAKIMNSHGAMLQVRSLSSLGTSGQNCDANANNLHQEVVGSEASPSGIF